MLTLTTLLMILARNPDIDCLGDSRFTVRERANAQLKSAGLLGFIPTAANLGHSDPEVRARCRRIVEDYRPWLRLQSFCVAFWAVCCTEQDEWAYHWFSTSDTEWLEGWVKSHPETCWFDLNTLAHWRRVLFNIPPPSIFPG